MVIRSRLCLAKEHLNLGPETLGHMAFWRWCRSSADSDGALRLFFFLGYQGRVRMSETNIPRYYTGSIITWPWTRAQLMVRCYQDKLRHERKNIKAVIRASGHLSAAGQEYRRMLGGVGHHFDVGDYYRSTTEHVPSQE